MAARRQVLFVQGAGTGTHDAWDSKVVDSLQRHLGDAFEVHYPQMPAEEDPHYATWRPAIRQALASLGGSAVVVGHSVGGAILTQTLVESPREAAPGAIVLVAAPFVGPGGWPGEEFELPRDLGGRLPRGVPVRATRSTPCPSTSPRRRAPNRRGTTPISSTLTSSRPCASSRGSPGATSQWLDRPGGIGSALRRHRVQRPTGRCDRARSRG